MSSIISEIIYQKCLKGTTWQYLLMDRLAQEKLIQCLVVIGRVPFQSRLKVSKDKIHFLKIWSQMRTMLDWSPEQFTVFSRKSRILSQIKVKATIFIVLFCRSITKRSTICCKTFRNRKLSICMSQNLMAFLSRDLLNMQLLIIWIVCNWWKEEKRIVLSDTHKKIWKVVEVIQFSRFCLSPLVLMQRACSEYFLS